MVESGTRFPALQVMKMNIAESSTTPSVEIRQDEWAPPSKGDNSRQLGIAICAQHQNFRRYPQLSVCSTLPASSGRVSINTLETIKTIIMISYHLR